MMLRKVTWTCLVVFVFTISLCTARMSRPRGVSITKNSLYDPEKDFACFDGSGKMPFSHVNDNYCDCNDGSDEPGTSACPNGSFHCTNAGFKPKNIPSSRVNDGICDCCDGSDEWANEGLCNDSCKEMWKAEHEDLLRQAAAASRGVQIRAEYSTRGMEKKTENQARLDTLKKELEEVKEEEQSLKAKKEEAQRVENDAKSAERLSWTNFKEKIQQQIGSRQAALAFMELDTDKDGSVSYSELLIHVELDGDPSDGEFSPDEAKSILGMEAVEAPIFIEEIWQKISGRFEHRPPQDHESTPEENVDSEENFDDEDDLDHDEDYQDDDDEEDEEFKDETDMEPPTPETDAQSNPESKIIESPGEEKEPEISLPDDPVWTNATKILIDAASEASKEHESSEKKLSDLEREIRNLEKTIGMDFGHDEAFSELHGKCFDLNTNEYTYKLCPFDRAAQKPKDGGSETSLGRWGEWSGKDGDKYSAMKYSNGLKCWNGPDRSTEVKISCGDQNQLLSASEPSRCEYRFEFTTPAACKPIDVPERPRDEL